MILAHLATTEDSALASSWDTLSIVDQQLFCARDSLSHQRNPSLGGLKDAVRRLFCRRKTKNTTGCPGMRLKATRGSSELSLIAPCLTRECFGKCLNAMVLVMFGVYLELLVTGKIQWLCVISCIDLTVRE